MKTGMIGPLLLALALLLPVAGCFSPGNSAQGAIAKTEKLRAQARAAQDLLDSKGRAYVYGTGVALVQAPDGAAVEMARKLNQNAGVTLGPPMAADAAVLDKAVAGALSGDPAKEKEAVSDLEKLNGTVVKLQTALAASQKKETLAEAAKDSLLLTNSSLAQTWVSLKRWAFWGASAIIALLFLPLLVRLVSLLSPALGPLLGLLTAPVAHMVRSAVENIPNVGARAGVVAKAAFDRTEAAAFNAIGALEQLKGDKETRERVRSVLKRRGGDLASETETLRLRRASSTPHSTSSGS